jgi:2-alkenal reductase
MDRFSRIALVVAIALLIALVGQPYIDRLLFATTTPQTVTPRGDLAAWEKSTVELFERVAPSVVQIVSQSADAQPGPGAPERDREGIGTGSGFVWDSVGHVVTNTHVVEGARAIVVRLAAGTVIEAELVGRAPNVDLAVLRLKQTASLPPPLLIGRSADLRVGQSVYAIGNPFGLDQTLTTGVISALKRRLPTRTGREIADVIQTDAAINPGNSGGPLLDSAGRLIGVNTAIFSPSGAFAGIGFAIPVDTVNRVVPQLIRTGRVPVAGIGILVADEATAARMGVTGVMVAQVMPNGPAAGAGLRGFDLQAGVIGDVITEANGKPVQRLADLTDLLEQIGVGKSVKLTLRRNNQTVTVDVPIVDIGQR